jgi:hypothetical protein
MPSVSDNPKASREKMKKEILGEIRSEERRRKRLSCLVWLAIKLIIILIPIVLVTAMIAKSGFYDIPVLTNWLYAPSSPTRVVTPLVGFDSEMIVKQAMARAEYEASVNRFKVYLTEQELTSLLAESLARMDEDAPLPVKSGQAAITEEGIELFLLTPRAERDVTVKTGLMPTTKDGEITMEIRSLEIGSLDMPKFAVKLMSQALAKQLSDALSMAESGLGELRDARVSEKRIDLEFQPTLKLPF